MLTREEQEFGTGGDGAERRGVMVNIEGGKYCQDVTENQLQSSRFDWREEFLANSSSVPGGKTDYSPTGTPVFAIVTGGVGGQASATLAADNAAMIAGFSWDDNLQIASDRVFRVGHRFELPADVAANQFALIGVAGAIETGVNPGTLAGLIFAGFYLTGDMVLKTLLMDGTNSLTETLDITILDDTFYWGRVERDQYGAINWYWGPGLGEDGDRVHTYATPSFSASQKLQPVALIGKSTGTTEPQLIVDTQKGTAYRSNSDVA